MSINNCVDAACNGAPREWEAVGIEADAIARPRTERLGANPVHTGVVTVSSIAMASNRFIVADTDTVTDIMVMVSGGQWSGW